MNPTSYNPLNRTPQGYPLPPGVMVTYPGEVDAVHKISGKIRGNGSIEPTFRQIDPPLPTRIIKG